MRRVVASEIEVRIEDGFPPDRAAKFLRRPTRHQAALKLWREALRQVASSAGINRQFSAGFILDDGRTAMTADGDGGAVVCINPERFAEATAKYGHEPLSLAAYLHGVACHELAHLDGRMGHGHDEEFIAAREDLGASTAHTIPEIAKSAACLLGLGPCDAEPTRYEAARQEAVRACEGGEICEAASDPLDAMVASLVGRLLDLRPGGLSHDYIAGFATRNAEKIRSTVAPLLNKTRFLRSTPTMTHATRPATLADIVVGAIVYKGNGRTKWEIVSIGGPSGDPNPACCGLAKTTSKTKRDGNAVYHFSELRVAV